MIISPASGLTGGKLKRENIFYVFGIWHTDTHSDWRDSFQQRSYGHRGKQAAKQLVSGEYATWQNVIIMHRDALAQFFTPSLSLLMDTDVEDGKLAKGRSEHLELLQWI